MRVHSQKRKMFRRCQQSPFSLLDQCSVQQSPQMHFYLHNGGEFCHTLKNKVNLFQINDSWRTTSTKCMSAPYFIIRSIVLELAFLLLNRHKGTCFLFYKISNSIELFNDVITNIKTSHFSTSVGVSTRLQQNICHLNTEIIQFGNWYV